LVRISWLFTQALEIQFSFNIIVIKVDRRICPVTYQKVGNPLLPCSKMHFPVPIYTTRIRHEREEKGLDHKIYEGSMGNLEARKGVHFQK